MAAANPRATSALALAGPRLLRGDLLGAAEQGTIGWLLGANAKGGEKVKALAQAVKAEAAAAEPAVASAAARGMSTTGGLPSYVPPPGSIGSLIATTGAKPAAASTIGGRPVTEVTEKIIEWRTKYGFSGPQIVSALKDVYGIASKEGNEIARTVISSLPK